MIRLTATESKILELISKGTNHTFGLMSRTGYARPTVTQAIRRLIDNGMVMAEGKNRSIIYKPVNKGA